MERMEQMEQMENVADFVALLVSLTWSLFYSVWSKSLLLSPHLPQAAGHTNSPSLQLEAMGNEG
jgi:hypothetical protein